MGLNDIKKIFENLKGKSGIQVFLHGSYADHTTTSFSDIDDFVIIDDFELNQDETLGLERILKNIEFQFYKIDPTRPQEAIEKIQLAMNEGFWENNLSSLSEARDLVLNKYQLFPFVVDNLNRNKEQKKWQYLPSNNSNESIDGKKVFVNVLKMQLKNLLNV